MKPTVLIVNASLAGSAGNTAVLLSRAKSGLARKSRVIDVELSDSFGFRECTAALGEADALIFGTGTHWDSWSSHLQRFFEDATPSEGSSLWLGKPAGVVVTMHSVGGKGVLSRLQGVLNTFGCTLPPMSGLVHSLAGQALIASGASGSDDVWCPEDVDIVCHNLLAALKAKPRYKRWPVDRSNYSRKWIHG